MREVPVKRPLLSVSTLNEINHILFYFYFCEMKQGIFMGHVLMKLHQRNAWMFSRKSVLWLRVVERCFFLFSQGASMQILKVLPDHKNKLLLKRLSSLLLCSHSSRPCTSLHRKEKPQTYNFIGCCTKGHVLVGKYWQ